MPKMDETEVFAHEAADVAQEAIKNGVARINMDWQTVFDNTMKDINEARQMIDLMMREGFIAQPDQELLEKARQLAIEAVK
jgi:malate dehydrogenase (oxaloacetate-decarboxylating)